MKNCNQNFTLWNHFRHAIALIVVMIAAVLMIPGMGLVILANWVGEG
jgi:hypothetical protein